MLEAHYWLYPPSQSTPPAADRLEGTGGQVLFPLKPDRLAEDFIAAQLAQAGRRELVTDLISVADQEVSRPAVRGCLDMMAGASRYPQVREVLFGWLRARSKLAGSAPSSVLYTVLEHGDRDLIETVDAALPRLSTELLRPARDIAQHLLDTLPASASPAERAQRLTTLGVRLSDIGDPQGALALAQETVEVCRQLAEAEPAAYLPDLAAAVTNLGSRLSAAGDTRAAVAVIQTAVAILGRLAEAEPAAYLPDLATVLTNFGINLSLAGDTRAALAPTQQAVAIRRRLAEAEPAAYLPDLAAALCAHAWVREADGSEIAEAIISATEAIEIFEQLAGQLPAAIAATSQIARATLERLHKVQ